LQHRRYCTLSGIFRVQRPYNSSNVSAVCPSTSSPKKDQKGFLDIDDSVASVIPVDADPSQVTKSVSGLHRCRSMSDIRRTRVTLTDSEIRLRSNLAAWTFLLEHSRKAVENQNKQEETLRKSITEAHDREAWLKKWLRVQKSTELQIKIYQRLVELLEGESGMTDLLRRFYINHLLPVSDRLPLEGLTLGDDFQGHLAAASQAGEEFVAAAAGDLNALGIIASQLTEMSRAILSSTSWLGNKEVVTKLTQACRLCLRLASLRTYRLQREMAQRLGAIPS
uniref:QWRF motif-containing protein 3 n=1 Tax=Hydatigena taeniaeformis TaxID=6205 RepID=A0A0R3WKC8_HYDTA